MAPIKLELFEVLTEQQQVREKILQEAARKPGVIPRKGGYRAELHGAAAKAARKTAQLELAMDHFSQNTDVAVLEDAKPKNKKKTEKSDKGPKKTKKK